MTDWIDVVDERVFHPATYWNNEPCIIVTASERDRLVKIARGVRELAERWEVEPQGMHTGHGHVRYDERRKLAAELRKLEDV